MQIWNHKGATQLHCLTWLSDMGRGLLSLLLLVRLGCCQLKWEKLNSTKSRATPSPRRDSSIGYDQANGRLVVFGGRDSDGSLSDTWIYDIQTEKWREMNSSSTPERRFSMVYGSTSSHFYISTGEKASGEFFNDVYRFNYSRLSWEEVEPRGNVRPEKRYGSGGGIWRTIAGSDADGEGLYVTHGFAGERFSNTFKFDLAKLEWEEVFGGTSSYEPFLPHARCLHAATMTAGDQLVLYGGCLG